MFDGPVRNVYMSSPAAPTDWVYFRSAAVPGGAVMRREQVSVSPNDRGFMFADGVYEVIRSYGGRLFRPQEHLARLRLSLETLRIVLPDLATLGPVAATLVARNRLTKGDATVYLEVTRGVHPRAHGLPREPGVPTVYMEAAPLDPRPEDTEQGVSCITVPDIRWSRCDIKSIALMPGMLARQAATEKGAAEAIFVHEGILTEGTHTNVFGVKGGTVLTHPATNRVLAGITRAIVLELCRDASIPVAERGIHEDELPGLDELFLVATTAEVTPVVQVNGSKVGEGLPGPATRRLQSAFRAHVSEALDA
jgi:D-alanine transaminase